MALLDNFSWADTDRPEVLGSLVLAAQACHDVAVAYRMPFISGKDSLKNEFHSREGRHIAIPPTLLISALGRVRDARQCVTMDLKEAGNYLYLPRSLVFWPSRNLLGEPYDHGFGLDPGDPSEGKSLLLSCPCGVTECWFRANEMSSLTCQLPTFTGPRRLESPIVA